MSEPSYTFTITGHITPAVRMTQKSKHADPRAQKYMASQKAIAWQLKEQMALRGWDMLPEQTPLMAQVSFWVESGLHKCDADNLIKAVIDSAQGIVFRNDLWIDSIMSARAIGAVDSCVFTISVIPKRWIPRVIMNMAGFRESLRI